jgi:hypothetical protein
MQGGVILASYRGVVRHTQSPDIDCRKKAADVPEPLARFLRNASYATFPEQTPNSAISARGDDECIWHQLGLEAFPASRRFDRARVIEASADPPTSAQ